jgi:hypothetical protein
MDMDFRKIIPVKEAVRIRPRESMTGENPCNECIRPQTGLPEVLFGVDKRFSFDYVFAESSGQVEIYEKLAQPLLYHLYKGYNASVLAYGQTGSGKTHTMGSSYASFSMAVRADPQYEALAGSTLNHMHGVIPRVLNDLFAHIAEETTTRFCVHVSFLEIYN